MLLSEDDLAAIDEYAVAKRRLTNRHLFGPGVVCGLDVACAPCDRRSVVVAPGYALDCCGNDIVSGCAQTVDVIDLLRELRQRTGTDCAEPCEDGPRQDYWLVARYTEWATDPLAPYQQDDCAVGNCEFSRTREGFVLELSCERPGTPPTLLDRLRACGKASREQTGAETGAEAAAAALRLATLETRISERVAAGRSPGLDPPRRADFDRLAGGGPASTQVVADAVALVTRSTLTLAAHAAGDTPKGLTEPARTMLGDRGRELAARVLASDALQELPPADREPAIRVLQTAQDADVRDLTLADRWWLAEGTTGDAAVRQFRASAAQARSALLGRIADAGRSGCEEYRAATDLDLDRLDARSLSRASWLAKQLLRVLGSCLCDEVNPPCPACADLRVPLAKVRIDGCDVIDVCDLDRDWVVSPRAFAYWLPIVQVLRQFLLARCCSDESPAVRGESELAPLEALAREAGPLLQDPAGQERFRPLVTALRDAAAADPQRPSAPGGAAAAAATSSASAASTAATAATTATASTTPGTSADDRVKALEQQVAQLAAQLTALTAGGGGQQ